MEKGKANDSVMLDVGARLESFKRVQWPFKDDCFCTPEKMAEAGFKAYYSEASAETKIDLAPLMEEMQRTMGRMGGRR